MTTGERRFQISNFKLTSPNPKSSIFNFQFPHNERSLVMPARSRIHVLSVLIGAALVPLFAARPAAAQSRIRQQRLAVLQQQNALQQQQNAVQAAVQQTNALLLSGNQQSVLPLPVVTTNLMDFQQQQNALQIALQQTTALLQASYQRSNPLTEFALRQQNALQVALQQTITLQGALSAQNGQLTPAQLQLLSQEQTSLTGLLTSPSPTVQRRATGR
jgi:hypothetical protein